MASTGKKTKTSNPQKAKKKFVKLMDQFLKGMQVVFPDCIHIKKLCLKFEVAMSLPANTKPYPREKLIRYWHKSMASFYERCAQKDETVWKEISQNPESYVAKLDLWTKWTSSSLSDENKSIIWSYIIPINKFSNKYNQLEPVSKLLENGAELASATSAATSLSKTRCVSLPLSEPPQSCSNGSEPQPASVVAGEREDTDQAMLQSIDKLKKGMDRAVYPALRQTIKTLNTKKKDGDRSTGKRQEPVFEFSEKALEESFNQFEKEMSANLPKGNPSGSPGGEFNLGEMFRFVRSNKKLMSAMKDLAKEFVKEKF